MISKINANIQAYTGITQAQKIQNSNYITSARLNNDTVSFTGNDNKKVGFFGKLAQKSVNILKKLKSRIAHNVVVISGPSGVGKDTIIEELRKTGYELQSTISYTTRAPRPGEVNGVHYHFITQQQFEEMDKKGLFFEQMKLGNGSRYGGTVGEINEKRMGHDVIKNISAEEASKIKNKFGKKAVLLFIKAPSMDEVEKRLIARGTETAESIKTRIAYGHQQMEEISKFDKVITNDKLDVAVKEVFEYLNGRQRGIVKITNSVIKALLKWVK